MLFGNRESLGIEIQPLQPTWERRYDAERAGWGALSLWVASKNLCRHVRSGSQQVSESLNVPLAPIADWLVRSWLAIEFEERPRLFALRAQLHDSLDRWAEFAPPSGVEEADWLDARDGWWSRHFLVAGADGAVLPDVAFARRDDLLAVEWAPNARDGRIFLTPPEVTRVEWDKAREALQAFVVQVAAWLREERVEPYPWVASENPLAAVEGTGLEVLALYTGRTEDELHALTGETTPERIVQALGLPSLTDPAASPVTQALRDLPPNLDRDWTEVLSGLEAATREGQVAGFDRHRSLARESRRPATTPEEEGQLAATAVREDLGLDGQAIADTEAILSLLGIQHPETSLANRSTRMLAGWRQGGGASAVVLSSPRTEKRWGRRFEQIRALGHLLLDPTHAGSLGAASSSFGSPLRRQRSGAFAAEFLLPGSALRQRTGGMLDAGADAQVFEGLMSSFGVGARTTAWQLWNHGLLSSSQVREDLIDQYAAGPA